MGMGRKKDREKQQDLLVASSEIVSIPADRSDLPEVLQGQFGPSVNHAGNILPNA